MNNYAILNATKKDSKETITKKYRKLALKYHPDKNNGCKKAEEQFKKISLAYQKIINPDKFSILNDVYTTKFTFDETKFTVLKDNILNSSKKLNDWYQNMKNMDFSDMTNSFIKEATRYKSFCEKNNKKIKKTDDIVINVQLKLEDVFNNVQKNLNIKRQRKCRTCLGLGMDINGKCIECKGSKYMTYSKNFNFHSNDKKIIFQNESNEEFNLIAGDIIINTKIKPHTKYYVLNECNILYQIETEQFDYQLNHEFKYLNDKNYNLNIESFSLNKIYKFPELGLLNNNDQRGDLLVQPILKPENIDNEKIELNVISE